MNNSYWRQQQPILPRLGVFCVTFSFRAATVRCTLTAATLGDALDLAKVQQHGMGRGDDEHISSDWTDFDAKFLGPWNKRPPYFVPQSLYFSIHIDFKCDPQSPLGNQLF